MKPSSPVANCLLAVLLVALSACSIFKSNKPLDQVYALQPAVMQAPATPPVKASLQLLRPLAQPGLEGNRIALTRPGNLLDYYAASRWAAPLPEVVASLASQSLRASGRFASVDSDRAGFGPDFVLAITIRHFEAEYTTGVEAPTARVVLECTLGSRRERETLATFDAQATVAADANRLGSVVAALERAAQQALQQAIDQSAAAAASGMLKPAAR